MKQKIKLIFKPYPEEIKGGQTLGLPYRCYDFSTEPDVGIQIRIEERSQLKLKQFCVDTLHQYMQMEHLNFEDYEYEFN